MTSRSVGLSIGAATAALICACVSAQPQTQAQARAPAQPESVLPDDECPTQLPDVLVTTVDTPGGIGIEFRTSGDVAALQDRVQMLALAQNQLNARESETLAEEATRRSIERALPPGVDSSEIFEPSGPGGATTGLDSSGPDIAPDIPAPRRSVEGIIPAESRAQPMDDGARLLIAPHSIENLAALRKQVRLRVALLQSGKCPVLASLRLRGTPS